MASSDDSNSKQKMSWAEDESSDEEDNHEEVCERECEKVELTFCFLGH